MTERRKILMLYPVEFGEGKNRGIYQKMMDQGKAFEDLKSEVDYLFIEGKGTVLHSEDERNSLDQGLFHGWTKYKRIFTTLTRLLDERQYDLIFLRHLVFTTPLYQAIKKAQSKGCKIIYEFPCWPYEKEWSKGMGSLLMSIDRRNRKRILRCVDLVVHFGGFNLEYVDHLQMSNGLYVEDSFRNKSENTIGAAQRLNMIAVGKWAAWHGLDRLIKGIASKANAYLDIIGEGPASSSIKRLVAKKNVNSIKFHGESHGEDLTKVLHSAHIGIGTLGIHRKKVRLNSSLKHRLYCAHGLPFILSSPDVDFPADWPFCLYVSENDRKINIKKIRKWYDELVRQYPGYRHQMFLYAKENLGWTRQMEQVLDTLENQD